MPLEGGESERDKTDREFTAIHDRSYRVPGVSVASSSSIQRFLKSPPLTRRSLEGYTAGPVELPLSLLPAKDRVSVNQVPTEHGRSDRGDMT